MNDSDYVVAFNILDSGYRQWWFPAGGLLMIPFSFLIFSVIEIQKGKNLANWKAVFIGFSLLWTVASFLFTFGDYWNCSRTFATGKASYAEGTVDNFVPMPEAGHANETFTVNGVPFSYSDYVVQAGFNNTRSHGGPIQQGLPVRIWYVVPDRSSMGNEIVKLEIAKRN